MNHGLVMHPDGFQSLDKRIATPLQIPQPSEKIIIRSFFACVGLLAHGTWLSIGPGRGQQGHLLHLGRALAWLRAAAFPVSHFLLSPLLSSSLSFGALFKSHAHPTLNRLSSSLFYNLRLTCIRYTQLLMNL
jgi:hypothetical protein